MRKIIDQFTESKASRQRKWQMRQKASNRCVRCGGTHESGGLCAECKAKRRIEFKKNKPPVEEKVEEEGTPVVVCQCSCDCADTASESTTV